MELKEFHFLSPILQGAARPFIVMGIVNVTPDSFFDGGKYFSIDRAVERACRMIDEGAQMVDIGGQSTRPGAQRVAIDEECRRIIPVIENVVQKVKAPVSVDTFSSVVAKRALDAGASWINDISAGRFDAAMPQLAAAKECRIILMHSRETPRTMQDHPMYGDVVAEVIAELRERIDVFIAAGVRSENIIIDPGIGFAKRFEDNITLLSRMGDLVALGHPVCVGASRKSFIGHISGKGPEERLLGSLASIAPAFEAGATVFRVHDVKETVQFLEVLHAIREGKRRNGIRESACAQPE